MLYWHLNANVTRCCCYVSTGTVLKGVPNNLEFLAALVEDPRFAAGDTTTKFLEDFHFSPRVMEVVMPGAR
jgi:biotin carboxylase